MNPIFPIIELVDRLAIAEIKFKRTKANEEELLWYMNQAIRIDLTQIVDEYEDLKQIHDEIWELEAELKTGRDAELSLEEIGRRAISIRDHNNKRIKLKNAMAEKLNCLVREIKKDHLSE
jgi:cell division septum initiation protein DivIVA